jgi:isopenicillin-N N-acyltransferase like protein
MTAPFPLIEIEGPPRERGRQYGRQTGTQIARGLALYGFAPGGVWMTVAHRFFAELQLSDPDLAAEMAGIAAGAEQPVEAIMALNARTELTAWDAAAPSPADECTSALAMPEATHDGVLLQGQNWDWRPGCLETSIVLKIHAAGQPSILTFCEAGQLARHGINTAGLALNANGLQTDRENARGGVPSPILRRRMLMQTRLADAIGLVLNTRRSASHNFLLSQQLEDGRTEAIDLETTVDETFWLFPDQGVLAHANHFKHPVALTRIRDIGLLRHPESLYRDRRVETQLAAAREAVTLATFQAAFADDFGTPHAVCRSPAARADGSVSATVATVILAPKPGRMWLAPVPYLGATYTEYALG